MIGSGIFLLPASLGSFGGISIVGWLVSAGGAVMMALVFSRLSRLVRKSGGPYTFTRGGASRGLRTRDQLGTHVGQRARRPYRRCGPARHDDLENHSARGHCHARLGLREHEQLRAVTRAINPRSRRSPPQSRSRCGRFSGSSRERRPRSTCTIPSERFRGPRSWERWALRPSISSVLLR